MTFEIHPKDLYIIDLYNRAKVATNEGDEKADMVYTTLAWLFNGGPAPEWEEKE